MKKKLVSLWEKQSKNNGKTYYSGVMADGTRVIAFINTNKKNPKQPDIEVFESQLEVNPQAVQISDETIFSDDDSIPF